MKKILAVILAMVFVVSVCSCSEQTSRSDEATTTTQTTVTTTAPTTTATTITTLTTQIVSTTQPITTPKPTPMYELIFTGSDSWDYGERVPWEYNINIFKDNQDEFERMVVYLKNNYLIKDPKIRINYNKTKQSLMFCDGEDNEKIVNDPLLENFIKKFNLWDIIGFGADSVSFSFYPRTGSKTTQDLTWDKDTYERAINGEMDSYVFCDTPAYGWTYYARNVW